MRNWNEMTMQVQPGQDFVIELKECVGCGFQWEVEFDSGLELLSTNDIPPTQRMPGASSTLQYRFRAKQPGRFRINATYRKPWIPLGQATGLDAETHISWMVSVA